MPEEIEGQESLYSMSPSDLLKRIDDKRKAWVRVRTRIAKNLEERSELRNQERKTHAEFMMSTGGGVQESIDDEDENDGLVVKAGDVITANEHSARRRQKVHDAAVHVLKCSPGGRMENTDLAALINVDPHGMAGYLAGSTLIRKEYDGRVGNGKLTWVLVETGAKAAA